jgi:uncharacterized lipoprotein YddW (UPF0748 family)
VLAVVKGKLGKANRRLRKGLLIGSLCILLLAIGALSVVYISPFFSHLPEAPELRGVWMQSRSFATPELLLETIARVETGRFNAIFIEVILDNGAFYNSSLVGKHQTVAADFDPLALLIREAHQRHIEVHAWFPVGYLIGNHPSPPVDWAVVNVDGTQRPYWLNFGHPDARRWAEDIILEVATNYDIDGVHLDYIRYPDLNVSFDSYSIQVMADEYGIDLEALRGSLLPAVGYFRGNPLVEVETAQVLARFDNDVPAVLLNRYGQGQVIVLNWIVEDRPIAASSQILARSIRYLQGHDSAVYFLSDDALSIWYHRRNVRALLNDLGTTPIEIEAEAIAGLEPNAVLVMPNVYKVPAQVAGQLEAFVAHGGGLIFIDGPVFSSDDSNIRLLTGMREGGRYFEQVMQLFPVGEHPIIPVGSENQELDYQNLLAQWNEFRTQGVNAFVQEMYECVKTVKPTALVSAAVKSEQNAAQRAFQDWPTWLKNGTIDLVIPMAYVRDAPHLERALLEWRLVATGHGASIVPGLSLDLMNQSSPNPKPVDQVLGQIELCRRNGYRGFVLFDIEHVNDDLLDALSSRLPFP